MKSVYLQIVDDLIEKISSGEYEEGCMLPSESTLCEIYNVSRMTLRKSLALLVEQDFLFRIKGTGTFVKKNKLAIHGASELLGFYKEVKSQGKDLTTEVLTFEILESDMMVGSKLNLDAHDMVYHIERVRFINGEPEMVERTYMPLSLFSDLTVDVMRESKYEYIKSKGLRISRSKQIVLPELAGKKLAKLLSTSENYPLLKVISIGELDDGTVFEYSINYFKLSEYSFEFYSYNND
ncbi:GntR family transcriptional regulator [Vibrio ruber]|uniref:GntR family transcriptional regulator n=1 Tax=Vibrio ruber TaxID=184755 RepID=UPI002892B5DE|nr:GntR family transcriptional regulator [Vibrio ruber]WNJ94284.1 GntR family transcriptional regulator [Vibrio ruber]